MSTTDTNHRLASVDTSGRIRIGKVRAGSLYDVAFEASGRVILTPVVVIPERELWLHRNLEAKELVETGLAEMARGETVSVDLSEFPEDDEED